MVPRDREEKLRQLAIGAISVIGVVSLSASLPLFGVIAAFFLPLPVLYVRLTNSRSTAVTVAGAAMVTTLVLAGRLTPDLFFYAGLLLFGYLMGEGWRQGQSKEQFVGRAILTVVGVSAAGVLLVAASAGTGPLTLLSRYVGENLRMTLSLYEQMDMPEETIALFRDALPQMTYYLVRILPAMIVAILLLTGWINLLAARRLLAKNRVTAPSLGEFKKWRIPDPIVWGVIGSGVLLMVPVSGIRLIGFSGLIALCPLYFLQGMAITAFWFDHKRVPGLIRGFLYTLILLQHLMMLVVMLVGLFDTWLDFRKRIQTPPKD